jgi:predicted kinase
MIIPKHSLILLWGSDSETKVTWALEKFPTHEILILDDVRVELTGQSNTPMNRFLVKEELRRRVALRLSMGQRVVLILDDQTHVDVPAWAEMCDQTCAIMVVVTFNQKLTTQRVKVVTHDQVISHVPAPDKLLAVGDVHGDHEHMLRAWQHAQDNHMHVIWLGDVIDYGDQNLKCLHLAYESVRNHQAHMIWGNHERKITRWMDADWGTHHRGRLSEANWKTIREIEHLNTYRRNRFRAAWKFLESASYQVLRAGDWHFTHGALHADAHDVTAHRVPGVAGEWAYFGQVLSSEPNAEGYPQRVWNWVDDLPAHARVVVGHDWIDRAHKQYVHKVGAQGAQVWCMDTGNSKGGQLSALEIDLKTNKWEVRVFKP